MKKAPEHAVRELVAAFALDIVRLVRVAVLERVAAELNQPAPCLPQAAPASPPVASQDDQPGDEPYLGQSNYDVDLEAWE